MKADRPIVFVLPKVAFLALIDGAFGGGGASGAAPWLRSQQAKAIKKLGRPTRDESSNR